jgi:hypothetical protein
LNIILNEGQRAMATDETHEPTPEDRTRPLITEPGARRGGHLHDSRRGGLALIAALVGLILLGGGFIIGFGTGYVMGDHHDNRPGVHQNMRDGRFGDQDRRGLRQRGNGQQRYGQPGFGQGQPGQQGTAPGAPSAPIAPTVPSAPVRLNLVRAVAPRNRFPRGHSHVHG